MAGRAEMGEIDEVARSKEDAQTEPLFNGDLSEEINENEDSQSSIKKIIENEQMEVDELDHSSEEVIDDDMDDDLLDDQENEEGIVCDDEEKDGVSEVHEEDTESQGESLKSKDGVLCDSEDEFKISEDKRTNGDKDNLLEIHEIIDDDEEIEEAIKNGINKTAETIELNDSGEGECDGDVMIIDEPKENGSSKRRRNSDELEVIELDEPPLKKKPEPKLTPTRRSVRNINKQTKSYAEELEKEEASSLHHTSEESDIEEVLPQDPLAVVTNDNKKPKQSTSSSTIVVKDTKRLVEIAAKSNSSNSGNKKEPTLVIIDTNSILSGRGPVPVNKPAIPTTTATQSYPAILPMALPAQGMYPPNMRATITPIPISVSTSITPAVPKTTPSIPLTISSTLPSPPLSTSALSSSSLTSSSLLSSSLPSSPIPPPSLPSATTMTMTPVLPTLTDDMFVVEAPSFIVPYVYEKPPVNDFKEFIKDLGEKIRNENKKSENAKEGETSDKNKETNGEQSKTSNDKSAKEDDVSLDPLKPMNPYFESPLGKFFTDIGCNLVQEYVQSDLLRQQKKKRDREGGQNPVTNKTIHSLIKNLEYSKENNEPFKTPLKKCEFCHFKTESQLVMAHHLETPHTKNYVYKCNFCAYEARSPHDILFHMEAEHAVRGRLERAPSFHQCPNCPFEDNQKGKLSRHLVACMRKFKPERNLEAPVDWEPPAKIPRVPKARQGINVSAYQAMKSSQLQFLSKMQLLHPNSTQHSLHGGRGRPTLTPPMKGQTMIRPTGMVCKQTVGGGSVLVPTNYQVSGNQVYQNQAKSKTMHQPSISITPLPRASTSPNVNVTSKPGDTNSKNSFVICEICDGYIKDLEQLRNHMQWIHKVKIHPKMIYNRPPLNCQKCQFRFFTDQGLERHLLGSHGLVTSSMQDAANKSKDNGRCPVCGRVFQWKLLNHVAHDHNMTLKPAHLSYKCTVCTATFGMYKQFENHVYSAHSVVAKRVMDKKNSSSASVSTNKNDQIMKPLKINDEITIIPQPAKPITSASKEGSPSTTGSTNSRNSPASTSKNADSTTANNSSAENASNDAKPAD